MVPLIDRPFSNVYSLVGKERSRQQQLTSSSTMDSSQTVFFEMGLLKTYFGAPRAFERPGQLSVFLELPFNFGGSGLLS